MIVLSLDAGRDLGMKRMLHASKENTVVWFVAMFNFFFFTPECRLCCTFQLWVASVRLINFLE